MLVHFSFSPISWLVGNLVTYSHVTRAAQNDQVTISVAITTAGTHANSFNNNRGVQITDLYALILKTVTSYVLATVNMNSHGVLGHADVSEDAAS